MFFLFQNKTVLTFNHGKHTARFNVGSKLKVRVYEKYFFNLQFILLVTLIYYARPFATLEARKNWSRNASRKCFWDRYPAGVVQLLEWLLVLSLVTVPEVFAEVNSTQFFLVSKVANFIRSLCIRASARGALTGLAFRLGFKINNVFDVTLRLSPKQNHQQTKTITRHIS